ncbi:MAG TPA: hypothetical protein VGQ17_12075 [Gemmatimonadales bacterium]|jgi:hypothetical protein|nr:hypothetical protein [Gemmatimonadales bacterium]
MSGGGNGGGSAGGNPSVTGTWQVVLVITVPGDIQTWTTTWRFDAAGSCQLTKTSFSLLEGFPRTTERDCRFVLSGGSVVVTYSDTGTTQSLPYSFAGFSPDRLVLEGLEYRRIG